MIKWANMYKEKLILSKSPLLAPFLLLMKARTYDILAKENMPCSIYFTQFISSIEVKCFHAKYYMF